MCKKKKKVGKSASQLLFLAVKRSHSFSTSGAFVQAHFHVTFREMDSSPRVCLCALSLSLSSYLEPAAKSQRKLEC